jgi:hypothetical protein
MTDVDGLREMFRRPNEIDELTDTQRAAVFGMIISEEDGIKPREVAEHVDASRTYIRHADAVEDKLVDEVRQEHSDKIHELRQVIANNGKKDYNGDTETKNVDINTAKNDRPLPENVYEKARENHEGGSTPLPEDVVKAREKVIEEHTREEADDIFGDAVAYTTARDQIRERLKKNGTNTDEQSNEDTTGTEDGADAATDETTGGGPVYSPDDVLLVTYECQNCGEEFERSYPPKRDIHGFGEYGHRNAEVKCKNHDSLLHLSRSCDTCHKVECPRCNIERVRVGRKRRINEDGEVIKEPWETDQELISPSSHTFKRGDNR